MKHALVMHTKIPITDWQKTHHSTCLPTCVHFLVASYPTWSNVQVSQQTVSFSDWNSNIAKCLIYAQQNTTMCTQMIVNKTKWMVSKTTVVPLGIHHLTQSIFLPYSHVTCQAWKTSSSQLKTTPEPMFTYVLAGKVLQSVVSANLLVCFATIFWTNWPLIWLFASVWVDDNLLGTDSQGHRSRLGLGFTR